MRILVFGGAGFVGLNIAAALLARGHAVTLFDRAGLPPDARKDFACHGDRLTAILGDVTNSQTVEAVIAAGYEAIILGAAITAGPEREASDPETILQVNLLAQVPILTAARRFGVGRIINLSSAAGHALAMRDHQRPAERRVRALGADERSARHAKPAGADSGRDARRPRGRSGASGRQGLDLCSGCRGGRDIADRGGEAEAPAL